MLGKGDYIEGQFTYGKGATDYVGPGLGSAQTRDPAAASPASVRLTTAVVTSATNAELTTGWSSPAASSTTGCRAGRRSLYGRTASSNTPRLPAPMHSPVRPVLSADWSFWQIGSRTVWTPVENLDLSVEVMYQNHERCVYRRRTVGDNDWWSGMFRAQRNFYP